MPDERFARIEATVEQLVAGQGRLESRMDDLAGQQGSFATQLAEVDQRLSDEMRAFREDVAEQLEAIPALEQRLGNQMRVLHEDVIERIKAISDPTEQAECAVARRRRE